MHRELFHVVTFLHHVYICCYVAQVDFSNVTHEFVKLAAGRLAWRFFSGWTFIVQLMFLTLAVLEDSLQVYSSVDMTKLRLQIAKFNNYLFVAFVVPLSAATCLVFWSVYFVDRELVFPAELDQLLGRWLNHGVHTHIVLVVLLEMALTKCYYPSTRQAMRDMGIYLAIYDLIFLYTHFIEGIWLYPIYAALNNWFQRILFMVYGHLSVIGFYFLGKVIHNAIWGNERREQSVSGQRSLRAKNS